VDYCVTDSAGKGFLVGGSCSWRQDSAVDDFAEPFAPVVGGLVMVRLSVKYSQTGSDELAHALERRRRLAAIFPACFRYAREWRLDNLGEFSDGIRADVFAMQPELASAICEGGGCHAWSLVVDQKLMSSSLASG